MQSMVRSRTIPLPEPPPIPGINPTSVILSRMDRFWNESAATGHFHINSVHLSTASRAYDNSKNGSVSKARDGCINPGRTAGHAHRGRRETKNIHGGGDKNLGDMMHITEGKVVGPNLVLGYNMPGEKTTTSKTSKRRSGKQNSNLPMKGKEQKKRTIHQRRRVSVVVHGVKRSGRCYSTTRERPSGHTVRSRMCFDPPHNTIFLKT